MVDGVRDRRVLEHRLHAVEVLERRFAEVVEEPRASGDESLQGRVLRVEHAQGVRDEPPARILVEVGLVPLEVGNQGSAVRAPLVRAAPSELRWSRMPSSPRSPHNRAHMRISSASTSGPGTPSASDVDLMELAIASLLWALVAIHRPHAPDPLRTRVEQRVFDRRAHDRRGHLRAEGEVLPVQLVDEAVHLLLDDVGRLADRAAEERGVLEERRADAAVAVAPRPGAHRLLEALPKLGLVREDVVHPPHRLDGLGHKGGRSTRRPSSSRRGQRPRAAPCRRGHRSCVRTPRRCAGNPRRCARPSA